MQDDQARVLVVQTHQLDCAQAQLGLIDSSLQELMTAQSGTEDLLTSLIAQAEASVPANEMAFDTAEQNVQLLNALLEESSSNACGPDSLLGTLDHVELSKADDWSSYLATVERYAGKHGIELSEDPFRTLMSPSQRIELEKRIQQDFTLKQANCDKYDYMIAGTCGLLGGLIDVFYVGAPGEGKLTKCSDEVANSAVQKFASFCGWKGPKEGSDPLKSAIGFLERKFPVPYDHQHTTAVGKRFNMNSKNHHLKSLGHSPDLVGLFFSILDQFNSTASFVAIFDEVDKSQKVVGQFSRVITVDTNHELHGSSFMSKLYCGFVNWLGHLFSDATGSSGGKGRGSGIPIPFYSLLQFVTVGLFDGKKDPETFATIAVKVFEQGYDARHGVALSIPVLIAELLTRLSWVVKQRCYHKQPWSECIPSAANPELRRMLLVAHGTLCAVDAADAAVRSGGEMIQFMLRSNLVAWARFGNLALKELAACYQSGNIDVEAVDSYLDAELTRMLAA